MKKKDVNFGKPASGGRLFPFLLFLIGVWALTGGCDILGQNGVHELTTRAAQPDRGTVTPADRQFSHKAAVVVSARPATGSGWEFYHWEGDVSGTDNPLTFTIRQDTEVVAHFGPERYTLTIEIEGEGRVGHRPSGSSGTPDESPEGIYTHGGLVEVFAVPDEGWEFDRWEGKDFNFNRTANPEILGMWEDQTLVAVFRRAD